MNYVSRGKLSTLIGYQLCPGLSSPEVYFDDNGAAYFEMVEFMSAIGYNAPANATSTNTNEYIRLGFAKELSKDDMLVPFYGRRKKRRTLMISFTGLAASVGNMIYGMHRNIYANFASYAEFAKASLLPDGTASVSTGVVAAVEPPQGLSSMFTLMEDIPGEPIDTGEAKVAEGEFIQATTDLVAVNATLQELVLAVKALTSTLAQAAIVLKPQPWPNHVPPPMKYQYDTSCTSGSPGNGVNHSSILQEVLKQAPYLGADPSGFVHTNHSG